MCFSSGPTELLSNGYAGSSHMDALVLVDDACTDCAPVGKELEGIFVLLRAKINENDRSLSDCSLTPVGVFWLETGLLLRNYRLHRS